MTNKEIIEMLLTQKAQIARIMARDELKQPFDPYAELKAAHAAGKRIAFNRSSLSHPAWEIIANPFFNLFHEYYKIVEDDETYYCQPHSPFGVLKTTFTKCALTGKITAEVVSND